MSKIKAYRVPAFAASWMTVFKKTKVGVCPNTPINRLLHSSLMCSIIRLCRNFAQDVAWVSDGRTDSCDESAHVQVWCNKNCKVFFCSIPVVVWTLQRELFVFWFVEASSFAEQSVLTWYLRQCRSTPLTTAYFASVSWQHYSSILFRYLAETYL